MRAVVQRVAHSSVKVAGEVTGKIERGLLVFLAVGKNDSEKDISYLADKIINLRIFEDEQGKMNASLLDINGDLLVVSQFTLYGDVRKGRRPSFDAAGSPEIAQNLYEKFIKYVADKNIKVETGVFQADMKVEILNDGPVTILLDSEKLF